MVVSSNFQRCAGSEWSAKEQLHHFVISLCIRFDAITLTMMSGLKHPGRFGNPFTKKKNIIIRLHRVVSPGWSSAVALMIFLHCTIVQAVTRCEALDVVWNSVDLFEL